jgi:hypothetical protein
MTTCSRSGTTKLGRPAIISYTYRPHMPFDRCIPHGGNAVCVQSAEIKFTRNEPAVFLKPHSVSLPPTTHASVGYGCINLLKCQADLRPVFLWLLAAFFKSKLMGHSFPKRGSSRRGPRRGRRRSQTQGDNPIDSLCTYGYRLI